MERQAAGDAEAEAGLEALAEPDDGKSSRGRSYVFTLNMKEDTSDDMANRLGAELANAWLGMSQVAQYAMQVERGGEQKRLHVQGWLYMKNACTFKAVHALFPKDTQPWVKRARGSPEQCWEYCTKNDTRVTGPWTKGTKPKGQGKRSDLSAFYEESKGLTDGKVTLEELQDTYTHVEARCTRWFDRVIDRRKPKRNWLTRCIYVHGPPGTGKTTAVMQWAKRDYNSVPYNLPIKPDSKAQQWWDHYKFTDGQTVMIEEFGPDTMKKEYFNRLIDATPLTVDEKGSFTQFVAKAVYITSNYDVDGGFPFADMSVIRRIHEIWQVEYHPEHKLNASGTNAEDAARNAIWTCTKSFRPVWPVHSASSVQL